MMMKLSDLLIKTRKELNLSQKQLADILELDESLIKFLEYGEPLWDTSKLKKKTRQIANERKHNRS